jgi:hypothetical protein
VSFTEILEELPKLTQEQRQAIYRQIEELDGAPLFEATDEMLVAIDEGTRSAKQKRFTQQMSYALRCGDGRVNGAFLTSL